MTSTIGDSNDVPLKANLAKPGVPATPAAPQKAPGADQEAKAHLAQQSHRLDLSKSKLPASELAALSVHFAAQEATPEEEPRMTVMVLGATGMPSEAGPVYGSPPIRRPKGLEDMTLKQGEVQLIYGAPV